MARQIYTVSRDEQKSQRITKNLQNSSQLLLEANRELKEATRAKSEFVSKMSHDFRATLNIISGFTELMLDEVPGPITEQQRQCLGDILAGSQRLTELVDEYLERRGTEQERVIPTTIKVR